MLLSRIYRRHHSLQISSPVPYFFAPSKYDPQLSLYQEAGKDHALSQYRKIISQVIEATIKDRLNFLDEIHVRAALVSL